VADNRSLKAGTSPRPANRPAGGRKKPAGGRTASEPELSHPDDARRRLRDKFLFTLLQLAAITALPAALSRRLWADVWGGVRPRAWDGAGHYAAAQIYAQSIFPDTLGWTHAYFAGMPFPNFYPPLYFWLIGLLTASHLFSLDAAFKLVTFTPVLLTPASVWFLSLKVSGRSRLAASAAALGCVALMLDERFIFLLPAGLDYFSTFQIGLYTQPLGFVLLVVWYAVYSDARQPTWKVAFSGVLLALTMLANFFGAVTAAVLTAATLTSDLFHYWRETDRPRRSAERRTLIAHAAIPLLAACFVLFWVVPVLGQYEYFVTKPYVIEAGQLVTPYLWAWYVLAAAGSILWLRNPTRQARAYLAACLVLALAAAGATIIAPRWFPLQAPRFLSTLNFLLTLPVGRLAAAGFRRLAALLGEMNNRSRGLSLKRARYTTATALALLVVFILASPSPRWGQARAFYGEAQQGEMRDLLTFAGAHRGGRYLVEVINPILTPAYADASFDARSLNAYLGSQGNETLTAVFHEDSPNALVMLPAVNALSNYPDSFGVSSALADDLDFAAQPLSKHIERARLLGVRYVVSRTPAMKEKLAGESSLGARHDFGWWSIFELRDEPPPRARVLPYRPALVVGAFTLKLRRSNEWSFARLVEEQFADGWFDVLLARSPEVKIDRLHNLEQFGALIITAWDYDDEGRAYAILKQFAQDKELILLSDGSELFKRISSSRADFPKLEIVERANTGPGEPMDALQPTRHYRNNPVRQAWESIRLALDKNKAPVDGSVATVVCELRGDKISLVPSPELAGAALPILVSNTFHPNWKRDDGEATYAATPFYTLTFAGGPVTLNYGRAWYESLAAWFSAGTLTLLCVYLLMTACMANRRD